MKLWAKAGLAGFIIAFIALWVILLISGHDSGGWKCVNLEGPEYCTFTKFISSMLHWGFVLLFSWVGFLGGVIDIKIIKKIISKRGDERKIPLKITSIVMLTLIFVFAAISLLIFEEWPQIILYSIIFFLFTLFVSWIIGRIKYKK